MRKNFDPKQAIRQTGILVDVCVSARICVMYECKWLPLTSHAIYPFKIVLLFRMLSAFFQAKSKRFYEVG